MMHGRSVLPDATAARPQTGPRPGLRRRWLRLSQSRKATGRSHVRRRWPIHPITAVSVPGPVAIVPVPIRSQRKGDDWEAEARSINEDRNAPGLIRIREVAGINPASVIGENHVAPAPVAQATHHLNRKAGLELGHHGIAAVWSRTNIDSSRRERLLCGRHNWNREKKCG